MGLPKIWTSPGKYPSIIDGAASLGSIETLKNLPETSNLVFSLHATKYLGSGEGGLVVTGTKEIADELRSWSNFGFQGSRQSMTQGTNAKMSEIQAAGSIITYLRRYSLSSILGIVTDEDVDGHVQKPSINALLQEVNLCTTKDQLKSVWDSYPDFHGTKEFSNLVASKNKSFGNNS